VAVRFYESGQHITAAEVYSRDHRLGIETGSAVQDPAVLHEESLIFSAEAPTKVIEKKTRTHFLGGMARVDAEVHLR
jgi:hypothetical protein